MNSPQSFGVVATHELLHQGGVAHPNESGSAPDAQINWIGGQNYVSTPTTTSKIAYNIMLYGFYNVDGKNVGETRGPNGGTQATPGQMDKISNNISQGKVNGEPMNDD